MTAALDNSSRSNATPSSAVRPNSTGQPKKRANSGMSALRACANATRIGRMLRPASSRRARTMTAIRNSAPCRPRGRGRPTKPISTTRPSRSCSQFQTPSLVDDPGIAVKERQGLAEVFRGGHRIEDDPRITRIGLLGEVKTESGVVNRFRGAVEEPALSHRRYAMVEGTARDEVVLGHARFTQHRGGRDVTPPQGVDRLLGRKPHRCRQALRGCVLGHVNAPRCHEQYGINSGLADKGKTRCEAPWLSCRDPRAPIRFTRPRSPEAIEPRPSD